jgi:hypothetical protein
MFILRIKDNWEEWLLFMIKAVDQTSRETIDDNLFKHPYTRIEFIQRDLNVSRINAANYLNQLADDKLLTKKKLATANYYINDPLFELLSKR